MRKFFRGGGDFGGPVTEGGSHAKKVGDHWYALSYEVVPRSAIMMHHHY